MTINRNPTTAGEALKGEKRSETDKTLKRAAENEKKGPPPHPTLEGIKRRKGAPEPASKT